MTELRLRPGYTHRYQQNAPRTVLTFETAFPVYEKLRNHIVIAIDCECPAAGWDRINDNNHRHLFRPNGFHHKVMFSEHLPKGYRRLDYDEFLVWYGIIS